MVPRRLTPISVGGIKYAFADAVPSGTGVVPVWNFKHAELEGMKDVDDLDLSDENESPNLSMVAERYYMNRSVLGDSPREEKSLTNGHIDESVLVLANDEKPQEAPASPVKKTAEAGCQTIVTGEVLATQLFHEEF